MALQSKPTRNSQHAVLSIQRRSSLTPVRRSTTFSVSAQSSSVLRPIGSVTESINPNSAQDDNLGTPHQDSFSCSHHAALTPTYDFNSLPNSGNKPATPEPYKPSDPPLSTPKPHLNSNGKLKVKNGNTACKKAFACTAVHQDIQPSHARDLPQPNSELLHSQDPWQTLRTPRLVRIFPAIPDFYPFFPNHPDPLS